MQPHCLASFHNLVTGYACNVNGRKLTNEATHRFERLSTETFISMGSGSGNSSAFSEWSEIWRVRRLLRMFIVRDIRSRYKDSLFGIFWTLLRPLVQLLIFYLVIGKFLGAERGIPNFAVYIFTGLTVWSLFFEIVYSGTAAIVNNSGIIKKVFIQRELFPLTSVGVALFNFSIQVLILLTAIFVTNGSIASIDVGSLIPALLLALLFSTGTALILSAANVYLRDTQYILDVSLMVLMWTSPIMYSWEMARATLGDGMIMFLYTANPITLAVLGFQKAFWAGGAEPQLAFPENLNIWLWLATLISFIFLLIAQRFFARLQGNFAQVV